MPSFNIGTLKLISNPREIGQPEISKHNRFMNWSNRFDGLEFNNDAFVHLEIEAISAL